jgi:phage baseplate assembly protein W
MKDLIATAILYFEPRIDVNKIDMDETNELDGKVIISIEYTIRSTNSRFNFVFPYYKTEGTEVKK